MKLSTRGEYGIRAMLYLALHGAGKPIPSHQIAESQGVPEAYLRQILAQLAKHRLVQSSRGPHGGHLLGAAPERINLRDILLCLEGQTTAVDDILSLPCTIKTGTASCVIREALLDVKREVDRVLEGMTLARLAERQRALWDEGIAVPYDTGTGGGSRLPVFRH